MQKALIHQKDLEVLSDLCLRHLRPIGEFVDRFFVQVFSFLGALSRKSPPWKEMEEFRVFFLLYWRVHSVWILFSEFFFSPELT